MFLSLPPLVFHICIFYQRCCVANCIYLFTGTCHQSLRRPAKSCCQVLTVRSFFLPPFLSPHPLLLFICFQARLTIIHSSRWYFNSASDFMLMSSEMPVTSGVSIGGATGVVAPASRRRQEPLKEGKTKKKQLSRIALFL